MTTERFVVVAVLDVPAAAVGVFPAEIGHRGTPSPTQRITLSGPGIGGKANGVGACATGGRGQKARLGARYATMPQGAPRETKPDPRAAGAAYEGIAGGGGQGARIAGRGAVSGSIG